VSTVFFCFVWFLFNDLLSPRHVWPKSKQSATAATGYEYERSACQIYKWESPRYTDPAEKEVIAWTDATVGPNGDIALFSVTSDIGVTTEFITGPIPISNEQQQVNYQHAMRHIEEACDWAVANCP
jgi:hypothetical protein